MKKLFIFAIWAFTAMGLQANVKPGIPIEGAPPCLSVSITGTHVKCYGASTGTATLTISGGTGPFKIIWSTGLTINSTMSTTSSITNLPAGYYDAQVIDLANGCSAFDIFNVTQPNLLTSSYTQVNIKCFGQSTGSIDLSVSGGLSPYTYAWSTGINVQDQTLRPAGTYTVTITDANLCTTTNSVTLTQPAQALDKSLTAENPSCFGYTNGSTDLTAWGGTTPYVYLWNPGSSPTQDLSGIGAGTYSVTITDANLCTQTASITLTNPPLLTHSLSSVSNLCYGETLGSINLTVNGGTLPIVYNWSNSNYVLSWDTEDLSNLANENYYVEVIDDNGCSFIDSVEISSPTEITSSITYFDVTSFGGSNGWINLSVSGGVGSYIYAWSNGAGTQDLTNLTAGWYVVTITDGNGCIKMDSAFISEPALPLAVSVDLTHITCFSYANGVLSAEASGGVGPYEYLWSTGSDDSEIDGLVAGTYGITVTDFNGNTTSGSYDLIQPDAIEIQSVVTDISCNGLSNGSIDISVTGGTAPYTYEWLNSQYVLAALTEDIVNKPADTYFVEVTDTLGCLGSASITIEQPDALILIIDHTDAYCAGSATGTANGIVIGGTAPYEYLWSTSETNAGISNLVAGSYTLTITDDHGCLASDSVIIGQPDSVLVHYSATPVTCIDQHDGTIIVFATGGNGSYNYLWNTSDVSPNLEGLYAGTYSITVTDMMGCIGEASIEVDVIEVGCINIPTSFTPNADGMNDVWRLDNSELYPAMYVRIYSRWGQVLYELDGLYEPWDGTYNGNPMPAETYYYFLRLTPDSPMMQGTVTIVR